jgi:hypothetical protein
VGGAFNGFEDGIGEGEGAVAFGHDAGDDVEGVGWKLGAGKQDHGNVRFVLADLLGKGEAVELRHVVVEDNGIERFRSGDAECGGTVGGTNGADTASGKNIFEEFEDGGIVINAQDKRGFCDGRITEWHMSVCRGRNEGSAIAWSHLNFHLSRDWTTKIAGSFAGSVKNL